MEKWGGKWEVEVTECLPVQNVLDKLELPKLTKIHSAYPSDILQPDIVPNDEVTGYSHINPICFI